MESLSIIDGFVGSIARPKESQPTILNPLIAGEVENLIHMN